MKLLFALPGFHKHDRGAEVALLSVADELGRAGNTVTVVGAGEEQAGKNYAFRHVGTVPRERFEWLPSLPVFRNETHWEDMFFATNMRRQIDLKTFDATVTCAFPFTHWALRKHGPGGPKHFFVTQNGDWAAYSDKSEYSKFSCDGLVCTNPDYLERNADKWNCALIPNGADLARFRPGLSAREKFGLPEDKKIVLMVSAFIETKRVADAVRAVAHTDDTFLVVAGDGPLRTDVEQLAASELPGRFKRITLPASEMPQLYNSADVFLHLSLLESFGNVFVEAMACGLPIVAHDTDRLRWIVGDQEFLGDTENQTELVALLGSALAAEKRSLNDNLERFSWPAIAQEYQAFFEATVNPSSASTAKMAVSAVSS